MANKTANAGVWVPLSEKNKITKEGEDLLILFENGQWRRYMEEDLPAEIITHFMIVPKVDESAPLVGRSLQECKMTKDLLIHVLKTVSLIDLSTCIFDEYEIDNQDGKSWVNAEDNGVVVDAIEWDGNIFRMMNNNGTMSPLNPMINGYMAAGIIASQPPVSDAVEFYEFVENDWFRSGYYKDGELMFQSRKESLTVISMKQLYSLFKQGK